MRLISTFLIFFLLPVCKNYGQFLIPGEGIMDIKIGVDWDQVEWELGFKGEKIDKLDVNPELHLIADQANVDFDYVVRYRHIMWLPISDLFFKDEKVCMIQLSSYPEYNQMLCEDIGTTEGLNFWDGKEKVQELYGGGGDLVSSGKSYTLFIEKGIGMELQDNAVRSMFIFQPHMK